MVLSYRLTAVTDCEDRVAVLLHSVRVDQQNRHPYCKGSRRPPSAPWPLRTSIQRANGPHGWPSWAAPKAPCLIPRRSQLGRELQLREVMYGTPDGTLRTRRHCQPPRLFHTDHTGQAKCEPLEICFGKRARRNLLPRATVPYWASPAHTTTDKDGAALCAERKHLPPPLLCAPCAPRAPAHHA